MESYGCPGRCPKCGVACLGAPAHHGPCATFGEDHDHPAPWTWPAALPCNLTTGHLPECAAKPHGEERR